MLVFIAIALALFLPFNLLAWRELTRIHPRHRRGITISIVAGNLMWPFLPLMRVSSDFARATRAIFGPVWFGWTAFTVLYAIVLFLILLAWIPFARRRKFHEFAHAPSKAFLWFVIIGFCVGCWQALVPLHIEHVPIEVANLPSSLEGKRLALLGDLHVGLFTRPSRLQKIFRTAASLQPDAVIIAGDLIDDDPFFVPKLLAGTHALPPSMPLFAVLGNHEMYGNPREVITRLRGSRIRLLVNQGAPLGQLWIAGVSDYAAARLAGDETLRPDVRKSLAGMPAGSFPLVVAHQPHIMTDVKRLGLPVALCAHTHGGQLGFRPFGWSLAGVFLRYHMGLYHSGATQLYVNTGTGFWLFPFRLGMTPEITLVELHRAAQPRSSPRS